MSATVHGAVLLILDGDPRVSAKDPGASHSAIDDLPGQSRVQSYSLEDPS